MICYACGLRHGRREPGPADWTMGACADCGALDMLTRREAFEITGLRAKEE